MRLEQLEALAISNDHEAQQRVWNAAHEWETTPSALRRALTQSTVDEADKRVLLEGGKDSGLCLIRHKGRAFLDQRRGERRLENIRRVVAATVA